MLYTRSVGGLFPRHFTLPDALNTSRDMGIRSVRTNTRALRREIHVHTKGVEDTGFEVLIGSVGNAEGCWLGWLACTTQKQPSSQTLQHQSAPVTQPWGHWRQHNDIASIYIYHGKFRNLLYFYRSWILPPSIIDYKIQIALLYQFIKRSSSHFFLVKLWEMFLYSQGLSLNIRKENSECIFSNLYFRINFNRKFKL